MSITQTKVAHLCKKTFQLIRKVVSANVDFITDHVTHFNQLGKTNVLHHGILFYIYTVFQKKEATKLLAVTLSNLNQF